jgi:hypothetical protein
MGKFLKQAMLDQGPTIKASRFSLPFAFASVLVREPDGMQASHMLPASGHRLELFTPRARDIRFEESPFPGFSGNSDTGKTRSGKLETLALQSLEDDCGC